METWNLEKEFEFFKDDKAYLNTTFMPTSINTSIPTIFYTLADIRTKTVFEALIDSKLCSTKSEARRVFEQGGITLFGYVIYNSNKPIKFTKSDKKKYMGLPEDDWMLPLVKFQVIGLGKKVLQVIIS
jgi:tyrosyl-tRNA synthetase